MADRPRYRTLVFDSARWDGFVFRPDDIVITTPPKCGTTWTQMICALLVFRTTTLDRSLDLISPWLEMQTRRTQDVFADLDAQQHRRFIKSHTPLDGLPWDDRVTYICVGRDPRDVFCSWDNHIANTDIDALLGARNDAVGFDDVEDLLAQGPPAYAETMVERFWGWVDDARPVTEWMSLAQTLHHLDTFWAVRDRPNVVMIHYDDLKADLEGQMRMLAGRLAIDVPEAQWPELVDAATFERMRERADVVAPDTTNRIWQDNKQFFHKGTSGQWRDLLDDVGLKRYFTRVDELVPAELSAWVHRDA